VINYSLGRGQIGPIVHSEDYEVFLLYINKFNTYLGRVYFCFWWSTRGYNNGSGRVLHIRLHAFPAYISRVPSYSVSAATTLVSAVVTPDPVDIGLY